MNWKRPVAIKHVSDTGTVTVRGYDAGRWRLEGPHAEEDLERIMAGHVCVVCWTVYPGPPRLHVAEILDEIEEFGRPRSQVKKLLAQGRCGVCASEVSKEMAAAMFMGEENAREAEPGQIVDGERRTESGLILPAGVG